MSSPASDNQQPATGHTIEEALAAIDAARVVSFELGRIVITRRALDKLTALQVNPDGFLNRHRRGEWGDLGEHDRDCNDVALKDGSRIFSSYKVEGLPEGKVWIITDAEDDDGKRNVTTILLPSDY